MKIQWKITDFPDALREGELTTTQRIYFSGEMRFGLWGQTLGFARCEIIQKIQIEFRLAIFDVGSRCGTF